MKVEIEMVIDGDESAVMDKVSQLVREAKEMGFTIKEIELKQKEEDEEKEEKHKSSKKKRKRR